MFIIGNCHIADANSAFRIRLMSLVASEPRMHTITEVRVHPNRTGSGLFDSSMTVGDRERRVKEVL